MVEFLLLVQATTSLWAIQFYSGHLEVMWEQFHLFIPNYKKQRVDENWKSPHVVN